MAIKVAPQAAGIPFYVETEAYFANAGGRLSLGDTVVFVVVPSDWLEDASEVLAST